MFKGLKGHVILSNSLSIGIVRFENNPANAFSKVNANFVLQNISLPNCADFQVKQRVYCLSDAQGSCIGRIEEVWRKDI